MKWECLYRDWTFYCSDKFNGFCLERRNIKKTQINIVEDAIWEQLPEEGVVFLAVYPTKDHPGYILFVGTDTYWIREDSEGWLVGGGKTDEKSDPFYGQSRERRFYRDGTVKNEIVYKPNEVFSDIPEKLIKRGTWVSNAMAKRFGII